MFEKTEIIDLKKRLHWSDEVINAINSKLKLYDNYILLLKEDKQKRDERARKIRRFYIKNDESVDESPNVMRYVDGEDDICTVIEKIYTDVLHMKLDERQYSNCCLCSSHVPAKLLTNICGTYKYTHSKFGSTDYELCPICIYMASNSTNFANYCSSNTTYDDKGLLKFRPTTDKYDSYWCIVHPNTINSEDALDNCSCGNPYGCYYCKIEPRFCLDNC